MNFTCEEGLLSISIKEEIEDIPMDDGMDIEPASYLDDDGDTALGYSSFKEEPVDPEMFVSQNLIEGDMPYNPTYPENYDEDDDEEGRIPCELCTKTFKDERGLRSHVLTHTEGKPFNCPACNKPFKVKAYLRQHKMYCSKNAKSISNRITEKRCICPICQKGFVTNCQLRRHILTHNDDKPFTCEVCAKSYKFRAYLRSHMTTHIPEKRHSCDICGKFFKQKGNLRRHKKYCGVGRVKIDTNLKERKCPCDVCGKKFINKDQLKVHLLIHSETRPFGCDYCGKAFKLKSILKKHIAAHLTVLDCKKCGTVFSRKLYLKKHIPICGDPNVKPPPERPFICDFCPRRYTTKRRLDKHLLKKHAVKIEPIDIDDSVRGNQSSEDSWQQPSESKKGVIDIGIIDGVSVPIMEIKIEPEDDSDTLRSDYSWQNSLQERESLAESNPHCGVINDNLP